MSDKKHIDRLFQEGFKDFEATPKDAVWKNIEAQLNQDNKKRRVIPIWWRYAGIAALLALLLTLGFNYFGSEKPSNNKVVNTDTNNENTNSSKNNTNKTENNVSTIIANSNTNIEVENTAKTKPETTSSEKTVIANAAKNASNSSVTTKSHITSTQNLVSNKNKTANGLSYTTKSTNNKNEGSSVNKSKLNSVLKNNNNIAEEKGVNSLFLDKEKAKTTLEASNKSNQTIAKTNNIEATENQEKNGLTIEEALENNIDLNEEEENSQNRWSVTPNAAPVYFNTMGSGSSIDPQFNGNSKTGNINMSYGVSASYALNKKLTIRSGVNRVNLGYNTNDVVVFQSVSSVNNSSLENVSAITNNSNSDFSSDVISTSSVTVESAKAAALIPNSFETSNASINQSLGFIEVPLELQYALLNRKFGINLIGGFSSLFLNNNEIFSEAENGDQTLLGEANNVNDFSYSANLGLGLNYKMTNSINFNLEPMFKYQINTFKNTSGNFTPFFIGVYTGFAIKF